MMLLMTVLLSIVLVELGHGQGVPPSTRPSAGELYCYRFIWYLHYMLTGVQLYLPYETRILTDYSMIHGGQVYYLDENTDGTNDALYCQSANSGSNIGVWYYPDGTQVPLFTGSFSDHLAPTSLFSKRFTGQIALARKAK